MGFRGIYHQRSRLLCRLLAAFWSLTTLLGVVQPAVSALTRITSAADIPAGSTLCRCPMCGHLHRASMKCPCCPSGHKMDGTTPTRQMTLCAACPTGNTHTVAALVWSEPAWLHAVQTLSLPSQRLEQLSPQTPPLRPLRYEPLPRPPCLLELR